MKQFPHYIQLDSMDCGPTCLRMIAKYYGRSYTLQNLREKCFIMLILIAQLVLSITQMGMGFIQNWISLHTSTRISISLISGFLTKLMKLPLRFFDVKHIGDMMQQISVQGVVLGQYHQIAPIFSVKQPVCLYLFFRLKRLWKAILPWG